MINVYIQKNLFTKDELDALSTEQYQFGEIETLGFAPEQYIMVFIECARNIGYNALYDAIKYVITSISNRFVHKKSDMERIPTIIDVKCGEDQFHLDTQVPLSEEAIREISKEVSAKVFK